MATNYEPKVCMECEHHPYETESGYNDNGCTCEPRLCALSKARYIKSARREAMATGKTLEYVLKEREEKREAAIARAYGDFLEWLQEECDG